jgi:nicotinate-nucleotide pyrophosphorylase (carboxylating)
MPGSTRSTPRCLASYLDPHTLDAEVSRALQEDVGTGDLTSLLIPDTDRAHARVISREPAVVCGQAWFEATFKGLDPKCRIRWRVAEGDEVTADVEICELDGHARALLTGERTALNFLQTLSGTATLARRFAKAISGTGAVVMDTRKTLPGLRLAQKYAVKIGGGENHRIGLYDGILIKENHIAAAGGIVSALNAARALNQTVPIQIEVESLDELETALQAGAKLILLDNFTLEQLRAAVLLNAGRAILEASGNVNLETIRFVAETGVQRISVGSLTKSVQAIDMSMRFEGT